MVKDILIFFFKTFGAVAFPLLGAYSTKRPIGHVRLYLNKNWKFWFYLHGYNICWQIYDYIFGIEKGLREILEKGLEKQ